MRKKLWIGERLLYDTLSEGGDGLGDFAHAQLVFRSEKEGTQKRAMHAVAKGKALGAHTGVEFVAEGGREFDVVAQKLVPSFGGRRDGLGVRSARGTAHRRPLTGVIKIWTLGVASAGPVKTPRRPWYPKERP